ncbi:unnamed protein product [Clonostachys byssicola]|uniref:Cutinase n=1 Tax=Clonostachys byssicola TaxID=160290 RepID=A0A9N9U9Z6_9HYPO|nr:unnamed protein product [Clonostachys byssicola]
MKFLYVVQTLIALALAKPLPETAVEVDLQNREDSIGISSVLVRDDLHNGGSACPKAILIFARGTMELDNMGLLVGPALAGGLEGILGSNNLWVQGVGGQYAANLEGNLFPDGSPPRAIQEMLNLLQLADTKCPNSKIVTGGYSQGAALVAAAIRDVKASIRQKIVGTVLFGYTKNKQRNGQVENYSTDRLRVYCNLGDLICEGTLIVLPPHLLYGVQAAGPAAQFLASKIN